jgi:protein-tyrosine-phosphatase
MAEAIAKQWASNSLGENHGWTICSGGLSEDYEPAGSPASDHGVTCMASKGLDTSQHRSQLLSPAQICSMSEQFDLHVYCVTASHQQWIHDMTDEGVQTGGQQPTRITTLGSLLRFCC